MQLIAPQLQATQCWACCAVTRGSTPWIPTCFCDSSLQAQPAHGSACALQQLLCRHAPQAHSQALQAGTLLCRAGASASAPCSPRPLPETSLQGKPAQRMCTYSSQCAGRPTHRSVRLVTCCRAGASAAIPKEPRLLRDSTRLRSAVSAGSAEAREGCGHRPTGPRLLSDRFLQAQGVAVCNCMPPAPTAAAILLSNHPQPTEVCKETDSVCCGGVGYLPLRSDRLACEYCGHTGWPASTAGTQAGL
jgi:hypothetical protein